MLDMLLPYVSKAANPGVPLLFPGADWPFPP